MSNSNFKASSSLFSVNLEQSPDSTEDFCMEKAVEIIRDYLLRKYTLTAQPIIKLGDGQLLILTAGEESPNSSLVCVVRSYLGKTRLITVNLEGAGPLNTGSLDHESGDFISRKETFGINNSSMDQIKNDLNGLFGLSDGVERLPVLKRGTRVPIYFPSSDERILEYDFNKTLVNENSKYQNIKILSSPSLGNCLLLDNLQNLAEVDLSYTQGLMNFGKVDYRDKEILILGGGDGGLLHELLKEQPKFVTMIDIDGLVLEKCREHLRGACGDTLDTLVGENYKVIVDDCLKYLDRYAGEGRKFDFVFNDLTDIPLSSEKTEVGRDLWLFVKTILNKSFKCLKPDGRYMNHAVGKGCVAALTAYEKVLNDLPFKVKFTQTSNWVPSFCEEWVFYQVALSREDEANGGEAKGQVKESEPVAEQAKE